MRQSLTNSFVCLKAVYLVHKYVYAGNARREGEEREEGGKERERGEGKVIIKK
jgi:hypothetical protein